MVVMVVLVVLVRMGRKSGRRVLVLAARGKQHSLTQIIVYQRETHLILLSTSILPCCSPMTSHPISIQHRQNGTPVFRQKAPSKPHPSQFSLLFQLQLQPHLQPHQYLRPHQQQYFPPSMSISTQAILRDTGLGSDVFLDGFEFGERRVF